ncbi:O-antigen polymerase [Croceivirga lutea]|uniref:O-antigen ligase family protein n=1 Tax=Croceivirga lutea TaxID=1775167 RepID=UPI00163B0D0D|nr:O-antigen ligase family protein [Croceivirga lutea]GGG55002.1 O-antigen polymerase [Croceivirga lutea]
MSPKTIIKLILLSFSFDYKGGLIQVLGGESSSTHTLQILFCFIAFAISGNIKTDLLKKVYSIRKILIPFFLFTIYCFINKSSLAPLYHSYKVNLMIWNLLTFTLIVLSINTAKQLRFFIIFGVFQIAAGILIGGLNFQADTRIGSGEPIILSRIAGILICFALYFKNGINKTINYLIGVVGFLALLLTATRTIFLSIALIHFIFLVYFEKATKTKFKKIATNVLFGLFLVLFLSINVLGVSNDLVNRSLSSFSLSTFTTGNVFTRFEHYGVGVKMFSENFLFGKGFGSYPVFALGYDERYYPHNLFIELVAELGIVGLAIFCYMLFQVWNALIKYDSIKYPHNQKKFAISIFLLGIISSMSSLDLPNQFVLFNAIVLTGILLLQKERITKLIIPV